MASALGNGSEQGGYTRAVFFGSTPDYDADNLHSDPDALGDSPDIADHYVGAVSIDSSGDFQPEIEFVWELIPFIDFSRATFSCGKVLSLDNNRIGVLLRAGGLEYR